MQCFNCFMSFEKEELWLNEMAEKGYIFKGVNCLSCYEFAKIDNAEKQHITVKIDFRMFKNYKDFEDYRTLFEDSGWKHVCGSQSSGYQYFIKEGAESDDDIFSDRHSKAIRYKRLANLWFLFAIALIPSVIISYTTGTFHIEDIFNFKSLYLTPGLWEMKGWTFIRQFLFETPFALMRSIGNFTMLLALFLALGMITHMNYRRELKKGV